MTQQYSHSDLTFITNESWNTLTDRFRTLIKDTKYFDVLVGYFYTSGFWQIYPEIESSEKIRILIWISTNREVYDTIQQSLIQSHTELKNSYSEIVTQEIESIKESDLFLSSTLNSKLSRKPEAVKLLDPVITLPTSLSSSWKLMI